MPKRRCGASTAGTRLNHFDLDARCPSMAGEVRVEPREDAMALVRLEALEMMMRRTLVVLMRRLL